MAPHPRHLITEPALGPSPLALLVAPGSPSVRLALKGAISLICVSKTRPTPDARSGGCDGNRPLIRGLGSVGDSELFLGRAAPVRECHRRGSFHLGF